MKFFSNLVFTRANTVHLFLKFFLFRINHYFFSIHFRLDFWSFFFIAFPYLINLVSWRARHVLRSWLIALNIHFLVYSSAVLINGICNLQYVLPDISTESRSDAVSYWGQVTSRLLFEWTLKVLSKLKSSIFIFIFKMNCFIHKNRSSNQSLERVCRPTQSKLIDGFAKCEIRTRNGWYRCVLFKFSHSTQFLSQAWVQNVIKTADVGIICGFVTCSYSITVKMLT